MMGKITYNKSELNTAFKLFGEKLELEEATEPSDVIWENQSISQMSIFKNSIFVNLTMFGFLICLLIFFIFAKNKGP
jgi:hypothetical protein